MPHPPRTLTHENRAVPLTEWAKQTRIRVGTIRRSRIDKQGWSVADAFATPIKAKWLMRHQG